MVTWLERDDESGLELWTPDSRQPSAPSTPWGCRLVGRGETEVMRVQGLSLNLHARAKG